MLERFKLPGEENDRAYSHCCWCVKLKNAPCYLSIFASLGVCWYYFLWDLTGGIWHMNDWSRSRENRLLALEAAPCLYILSWVMTFITENPQWLVRAAVANLLVFPLSNIIAFWPMNDY